MLTDEEIKVIDEAEKRTTDAPWSAKMLCSDVSLPDDTVFTCLARNHMRALIDEVKDWRTNRELLSNKRIRDEVLLLNDKLRIELEGALKALKLIELWDAYPDLSDFKYYDAFKFLRPKIAEAIARIKDSGLLQENPNFTPKERGRKDDYE